MHQQPINASFSLPLPEEGIDLAEQVIGPPKTPSYKPQFGDFNFEPELYYSQNADMKPNYSPSAYLRGTYIDKEAPCYLPPIEDLSDDDSKEIQAFPQRQLGQKYQKPTEEGFFDITLNREDFDLYLCSQAHSYPLAPQSPGYANQSKLCFEAKELSFELEKPLLERCATESVDGQQKKVEPEAPVSRARSGHQLNNTIQKNQQNIKKLPVNKNKRGVKSQSKQAKARESPVEDSLQLQSSSNSFQANSNSELSSHMQGSNQQAKKALRAKPFLKGKKRTNDVGYLNKGYTELEEKIAEVQADQMKRAPFEGTRKKWNRISALRVRLREREHALKFEQLFQIKDSKSEILLKELESVVTPEQMAVISQRVRTCWKKSDMQNPKLQELKVTKFGARVNGVQRPVQIEDGVKQAPIVDTTPSALDDPKSTLRNLMEEQFTQTKDFNQYFLRNEECEQ